ncbi:uncharacterized protein LOC144824326 [Lissotriton helveticus]
MGKKRTDKPKEKGGATLDSYLVKVTSLITEEIERTERRLSMDPGHTITAIVHDIPEDVDSQPINLTPGLPRDLIDLAGPPCTSMSVQDQSQNLSPTGFIEDASLCSPGWEHFGTAGLAQRGFHKDIGVHARGVGVPLQTSSSVAAGANLDVSDEEEMIGDSPVRGVPLKGCIRGRSLERCQGSLVDADLRRSRSVSSVAFRDPSTPVQTFSFQDRNRCGGPDLAGRGPVPSRQGEVRRVPSAALSVPTRDPAAASTRGSGVTPLAPTSSRYRWQALPAAKELQSQRAGRYGRVQPAPPPGVSKSFKCTVVDTGLGKTRDELLHTSADSVVLDYDEDSPEEGEVRDTERGVPSHVSYSVLQAPVVQSQVQGRREHGPSSRAPRRPDALTSETRAEPSRVVSLLPGSVAGPRSSVVTVWIVGHSFVKWARVQAARSYFGDLLGFNDRMFNVLWKGKGGMLWRELIPCLNNNMVGGVCPDILVIHLGENDLCATKGVVLLRAMKRDLGLIKEHRIANARGSRVNMNNNDDKGHSGLVLCQMSKYRKEKPVHVTNAVGSQYMLLFSVRNL